MATLALAAAGAAAGSSLLPGGLSLLGMTVSGATLGAQAGALAGAFVDQALFGSSGQSRAVAGPRLSDLRVTTSTEGAPIPRVYGRARLGGQIIWATDFEEEVATSEAGGGGKGGLSSGASVSQTEYRYYANFAVALAEGELAGVERIWADGQELDLSGVTWRLHTGSDMQTTDGLIQSREGADAPAYRGIAYVVFERLPLRAFGNRIPQLSFEVIRGGDPFAASIRGVVLIPGSGEFMAGTEPVTRIGFAGERTAENTHTNSGLTDAVVSVSQLRTQLPNATSVSLVVSWFGDDLRCATCGIRPKVERLDKATSPLIWSVAGLTRGIASAVSQQDGQAAYGGTPSDETIVDQIRHLQSQGLAVTLNPFVLMDIPPGNALPNPLDGSDTQPPYPWRGRITCDPAPGRPGTVDKTATAAAQLASFVGTAAVTDFTLGGDAVVYSGPAEWSYRRFILHYAWLAKAAGGVSAFLIGSELMGLTSIRSNASDYPFVAALQQLATDVKAILGPSVKVSYAADWSEYFGHQPRDGSGDVHFNLDALWASPNIDAVGIDLYWPLADWRDDDTHLDRLAGARSVYDLAYLKGNLAGGEGFDWYYASESDREAQQRTAITDGDGKPWIFRFKDMKSWWLNTHYDRPAGVESATPTTWVPQAKPFWLMEVGCAAVDKAANEPNAFVDAKSVETRLPRYSSGRRDDLMQRRYLQAILGGFDPDSADYVADLNPISSVYGGRMIDVARTHVYAWDMRPYPAFPADAGTWSDAGNWRLGHWLNGRVTSIGLDRLVAQVMADYDFDAFDATALQGLVPGFVVDRIMAPRDALQPLELSCFFDSLESGGAIVHRHRGAEPPVAVMTEDLLVEGPRGAAPVTLTRGQETDLPASAKLSFISADAEYRQAVAEARRLTGASGRVAQAEMPIVLEAETAAEISESWLHETWASRERANFVLPPSRLAIEPGDALTIDTGGRARLMRVVDVGDHGARTIEARALDPAIYARAPQPARDRSVVAAALSGQSEVYFLDLPKLTGEEPDGAVYVAAAQEPWPGPLAIYRSPDQTGYRLQGFVNAAATVGVTLDALPPGPEGRIDYANRIRVHIGATRQLASATRLKMLSGANLMAVTTAAGDRELIQFETATLIAPSTYELSDLLRGQAGTELASGGLTIAAGATVVLIDASIARLDLAFADLGAPFNWRIGPAARDLGSDMYVTAIHAFRGVGMRPLSPVHVRGSRSGGDLAITWIRRTRSGGDGWAAAEVPLGEEGETYEVDILDGVTIKRTIATTTPLALYTAAQQIADFGAEQSEVAVRVQQISSLWGRGTPRSAVI